MPTNKSHTRGNKKLASRTKRQTCPCIGQSNSRVVPGPPFDTVTTEMFSYAYSPSTGFDPTRADALDDENQLVPRHSVTLQELAMERPPRGLLGTAMSGAPNRRAFGDLSNSNPAGSGHAGLRKRAGTRSHDSQEGGSARSVATTAVSDASTLPMRMDWSDMTRAEIFAIQAQRARAGVSKDGIAGGYGLPMDDHSPRTPGGHVTSPAESTATRDTDDTVPPGALTIARAAYAARSYEGSRNAMEVEHAKQHGMPYESNVTQLLQWRDKSRSGFVFLAGVASLTLPNAPGFFTARMPYISPVVVCAYIGMGYLVRASLLQSVFSKRTHNLSINANAAKRVAETLAVRLNAIVDKHDDVLSGRDNAKVLMTFTALFSVAKLQTYLNSTWWVLCVVWCVCFVVPKVVSTQTPRIAKVRNFARAEILGRAFKLPAEQRWALGVVALLGSWYVAWFELKLVLAFVSFVSLRLWRETNKAHAARLDAAMRSASASVNRRLSRAGSEFRSALVGGTPSFLIRKRFR